MKMTTCLQCHWQQYVEWYLAFWMKRILYFLNYMSEFCHCLYLLLSHVHGSKLILYIVCYIPVATRLALCLWPALVCNLRCILSAQAMHQDDPNATATLERTLKNLILHSNPWHATEDPPPLLQLHCSHNVTQDLNMMIHALQHISTQALLDVDIPDDWNYVKSHKIRTQINL